MSNPYGNTRHGHHGTLTYARWKSMMQRCCNPNASNYRYYGGKGVTVWEPWRASFECFLVDMGECPSPSMTLERLDNSVGYRPDNCVWAEKAMQARNRSNCVSLTLDGRTMIVADWAQELGVSANALRQRLAAGWSAERTLTTPIKPRAR